jgi:hypothetical protein
MHAAATAETRKLDDQRCRNNFMVPAPGFNLAEKIIVSYLGIIAKEPML